MLAFAMQSRTNNFVNFFFRQIANGWIGGTANTSVAVTKFIYCVISHSFFTEIRLLFYPVIIALRFPPSAATVSLSSSTALVMGRWAIVEALSM